MAASPTGSSDPSLTGQIAVVSGGLGDIGRAIARALHDAGARVALSDLASRAVARRSMPGYHYSRVNVTRPAAIERWLARVTRDLGPPSLVICNAGIVEPGPALATTPAMWKRTLDVNLSGAFFMAQSTARGMLRKKIRGRIVFVGSWAGHVPHSSITTYSVAKSGLRMAMQCLALEVAPAGILVNEIAPGIVDAGLSAKIMARRPAHRAKLLQQIPLHRLLRAEDVAHGVISLCDPRNTHMTGSVLLLDGGLTMHGPV